MRKSWRQYGEVCIPSEDRVGRPKPLNHVLEEELLAYLEQRPMAYLDEMAFFLLDEFDVRVGEATVWRALTRLGW
jgi:transposase